ncbi:hypothetical protein NQ318_012906 [Aromia moschata]|uniref:Uncharacterized protein n=1 Tax=Aromia moschata TaxID=1265417 RepID=A0AAV8YC94_9CUCU|nr:hypothetical protein NQ318_012906 [Aromia moschata]
MAHQSWQINGHANPTFQQSQQSLNETEDLDELYNNRPASVRSSYSNFHGTRALNYSPPKHYHSHATPQVPQKRSNPNRNSMRSMAFLNNGPPAYTQQVPSHVDSETPMHTFDTETRVAAESSLPLSRGRKSPNPSSTRYGDAHRSPGQNAWLYE